MAFWALDRIVRSLADLIFSNTGRRELSANGMCPSLTNRTGFGLEAGL